MLSFFPNNLEWLVALLVGGTLLLLARQQHRHQARLEREGVIVPGLVCRLERDRNVFYPVVRFQTHQQEWITGRHCVGSNPASYREGEQVSIRYHPADPHHFGIVSGGQAILVWGLAATGIGLIAYGLFSLFRS